MKGHHFEQGFDLRVYPDRLHQPSRWKKPRRIFVNSMSDLFHGEIATRTVNAIFTEMMKANQHTYQVLTKRPGRMKRVVKNRFFDESVPSHIWLGVSVEDQETAEMRIPKLLGVRSRSRFLSIEPLLERIEITKFLRTSDVHWVIVGGESGPKSRWMNPEWASNIRAVCQQYDVPFFFKQHGGLRPKSHGRILDGQTWDEMPTM